MILTGPEIAREVADGRIIIDPFDERQLNPNSYNFRLGPTLLHYQDAVLDPRRCMTTDVMTIPEAGFVLQPDRLVLGHIAERIGSEHFVPMIKGRSSIGRLGLFINITAELVDQGAIGQWTLQFHAVQPVRIYPGMLIGQMTFWVPRGQPMLYQGKYQGATGPEASKAWQDAD